jgi:tetratricopeptide (TPR) repeat protein
MQCALAIKAEADGHLRSKNLLEASFRYEHALAGFKWLQNADPGWKKKGINDNDITEHAYSPANSDEASQVATLLVALYLNLARVYFKTNDFTTAITACGAALDVDADCDKALFLRAQVRIAPASAGATEHEASLKDAAAAQKVTFQAANRRISQEVRKHSTLGVILFVRVHIGALTSKEFEILSYAIVYCLMSFFHYFSFFVYYVFEASFTTRTLLLLLQVLAKKLATADAKLAALQASTSPSLVNEEAVEPEADGCFDLDNATNSNKSTEPAPISSSTSSSSCDLAAATSPDSALATAESERADVTKRAREVR